MFESKWVKKTSQIISIVTAWPSQLHMWRRPFNPSIHPSIHPPIPSIHPPIYLSIQRYMSWKHELQCMKLWIHDIIIHVNSASTVSDDGIHGIGHRFDIVVSLAPHLNQCDGFGKTWKKETTAVRSFTTFQELPSGNQPWLAGQFLLSLMIFPLAMVVGFPSGHIWRPKGKPIHISSI